MFLPITNKYNFLLNLFIKDVNKIVYWNNYIVVKYKKIEKISIEFLEKFS